MLRSSSFPMDVSILIVSYNTREKTLACLRSIVRETNGVEYEVLVLDNASLDGSAQAIGAAFPSVHLDRQAQNLGFACGINRLAHAARGRRLLLLNPDAEILDNAVGKLVALANEHGEPGILGGRTLNPDGSSDSGFAWTRATPWSTLCNASGLAGLFPGSALLDPEGLGARLGDGLHEVDIVSGCCFLVDRGLWDRLGGFEPAYFVYGEEADFCLRAAALGIRPRVTSSAAIIHHGGASEASLEGKQLKLLAAKRRLMQNHWSKGSARMGAWLLAGHVLLRSIGFGALSVVRTKRFASRARSWRSVWRSRKRWMAGRFPEEQVAHDMPARPSMGSEEPALR